jgi:hypothetical protein
MIYSGVMPVKRRTKNASPLTQTVGAASPERKNKMIRIGIGCTLLWIVIFLPMAGIQDTKGGFVVWLLLAAIALALLIIPML